MYKRQNYGFDKDTAEAREGAAGLFSVMCGAALTPDMFGTPEYDEAVKPVSALLWVDENTVPSLMAVSYTHLDVYKRQP